MSWTDEMIARLRVLHPKLSCARLADTLNAEFGTTFTRNAVIGKSSRLGLGTAWQPANRVKPQSRTTPFRPPRPVAEPVLPIEQISDLPPDISPCAVTLMKLTAHTCRWPLSDPKTTGFMFCGAQPIDGSPYCPRHYRIAYQPAARNFHRRTA